MISPTVMCMRDKKKIETQISLKVKILDSKVNKKMPDCIYNVFNNYFLKYFFYLKIHQNNIFFIFLKKNSHHHIKTIQ